MTVLVITVAAGTVLAFLSPLIDGIAAFLKYVLFLILVLINVTPVVISWRMFQDGRS